MGWHSRGVTIGVPLLPRKKEANRKRLQVFIRRLRHFGIGTLAENAVKLHERGRIVLE